MTEYEYRVLKYTPWSDYWHELRTRKGPAVYRKLGTARGVMTRQVNDVERVKRWGRDPGIEYKIQRRPIDTEWVDVDD